MPIPQPMRGWLHRENISILIAGDFKLLDIFQGPE
jgi:hypothetical protein